MTNFNPNDTVKVIQGNIRSVWKKGRIGRVVSKNEWHIHWPFTDIPENKIAVFLKGEEKPYINHPSTFQLIKQGIVNWKERFS